MAAACVTQQHLNGSMFDLLLELSAGAIVIPMAITAAKLTATAPIRPEDRDRFARPRAAEIAMPPEQARRCPLSLQPGSPYGGEESPKIARTVGSARFSGPLARAKTRVNAGSAGGSRESCAKTVWLVERTGFG
jgi:hypothetical protein